jgi:hypothetical protein
MPHPVAASAAFLIVVLPIFAVILYRQRQVRQISTSLALPLALGVAGVASLACASPVPLSPAALPVLCLLLGLDAVGLGALRATTVRVWRDDGRWLRQGTWLTIGLWLTGALAHMGVDAAAHLGSANVVLYLAVTYATQTLVLRRRIGGPLPGNHPFVRGEAALSSPRMRP